MSEKYFRTFHLPYSPGGTNDDKRIASDQHFTGREIVVTEKMDGSNVCLTHKAVFARSHSKLPTHSSFDPLKALHAKISHLIPEDYSLFGEWCFAVHSIEYTALPAYFMLFAIRDDSTDIWLSWNHVEFHAQKLELTTVPLLWGPAELTTCKLQSLVEVAVEQPSKGGAPGPEGVVVRLAGAFQDPSKSIAKWVRKDHVQTDDHWSHKAIQKNRLANG